MPRGASPKSEAKSDLKSDLKQEVERYASHDEHAEASTTPRERDDGGGANGKLEDRQRGRRGTGHRRRNTVRRAKAS